MPNSVEHVYIKQRNVKLCRKRLHKTENCKTEENVYIKQKMQTVENVYMKQQNAKLEKKVST